MKILFLLFLSIISVNSDKYISDLTYVHKKNVKQIVLRRGHYTTDILPKKQLTCFKKDSRNYQRNCNETLPIIICKNITIDKDGKFNCLCTKNNVLVGVMCSEHPENKDYILKGSCRGVYVIHNVEKIRNFLLFFIVIFGGIVYSDEIKWFINLFRMDLSFMTKNRNVEEK